MLGERPDLQQQLRDDRSLIPAFVEEVLRLESPLKGQFRMARHTTDLDGVAIDAGDTVMVLPGAANRDPRMFECPQEFRLDRPNGRQHLAFGHGIHTCAGAPLARAEGRVGIERLLDRMLDIKLSDEHHGPPGPPPLRLHADVLHARARTALHRVHSRVEVNADSEMTADDLFLPEPEPREVKYTVISVDDHVVEPPHTFEGRLPAALQDRAPRIVETRQRPSGLGVRGRSATRQVGMNAVAGRRPETVKLEPFRFDQMRPGCYDVDARVRDMDINGVWASVNFPSQITGFCGSVFFGIADRELGAACVRAWNDWLFEEWYQRYPERIVPARHHLPRRPDDRGRRDPPQRGARLHVGDVPGTAARDRPAVAVGARPLGPDHRGVRRDRHRDLAARRQLGHLRRTRRARRRSQLAATLFGQLSMGACAEWLWSEYPVKHPDLKIAMSEGGIGWVAMLLDRLDYIVDHSSYGAGLGRTARPTCCKRNFWFCTLEDRSTIDTRYRIGVENIMVEVDYPARRQHAGPTRSSSSTRRGATCPPASCAPCAARTRPRSTATRSRRSCCLPRPG